MGSTLSTLDQETFLEVVTCFKKMKEESERGYTTCLCKNQTEDFVKVFTALGYEVGDEHVKWGNPQETTAYAATRSGGAHIDPVKKLYETSFSPSVRAKVFAEVVQGCEKRMRDTYYTKLELSGTGFSPNYIPFCSTERLSESEIRDFKNLFIWANPQTPLSGRVGQGFDMEDYMFYIENIVWDDADFWGGL